VGKLILIIITYLVAIRTINEDIQVEVVPTESVCPTECEVRQRRADVSAVVSVNLAVGHTVWTAKIFILDITYPYGGILGIYTINGRMKGFGRILNVFLRGVVAIAYITIEVKE
jgi:hypothetical protein